ncbi:hypothetical protein D3C86_1777680 [compost metagenome]
MLALALALGRPPKEDGVPQADEPVDVPPRLVDAAALPPLLHEVPPTERPPREKPPLEPPAETVSRSSGGISCRNRDGAFAAERPKSVRMRAHVRNSSCSARVMPT